MYFIYKDILFPWVLPGASYIYPDIMLGLLSYRAPANNLYENLLIDMPRNY